MINEKIMASLRSSIADMIAYTPKRRSVDLTFRVASAGADADPDVQVGVRRAMTYRRHGTKEREAAEIMKKRLEIYHTQKALGTYQGKRRTAEENIGRTPKASKQIETKEAMQCNRTSRVVA